MHYINQNSRKIKDHTMAKNPNELGKKRSLNDALESNRLG